MSLRRFTENIYASSTYRKKTWGYKPCLKVLQLNIKTTKLGIYTYLYLQIYKNVRKVSFLHFYLTSYFMLANF